MRLDKLIRYLQVLEKAHGGSARVFIGDHKNQNHGWGHRIGCVTVRDVPDAVTRTPAEITIHRSGAFT